MDQGRQAGGQLLGSLDWGPDHPNSKANMYTCPLHWSWWLGTLWGRGKQQGPETVQVTVEDTASPDLQAEWDPDSKAGT